MDSFSKQHTATRDLQPGEYILLTRYPRTKPGCFGHSWVSSRVPPEYMPYGTGHLLRGGAMRKTAWDLQRNIKFGSRSIGVSAYTWNNTPIQSSLEQLSCFS